MLSDQVPISHAPASQHTPAYKIFRYPFVCMVATMHMISQQYMEELGLVTTGDRETDLQLLRTPRHVQLTVAQMATMFYEGVSIQLTNPEVDSIKIYEMVRDHLSDWQSRINNSPHEVDDNVIEDLRKLDALAAEVYKTARQYMPAQFEESKLFRRLGGMGAGMSARHRSPRAVQRQLEEKPLVAADHNPVADAIARQVFNRRARTE